MARSEGVKEFIGRVGRGLMGHPIEVGLFGTSAKALMDWTTLGWIGSCGLYMYDDRSLLNVASQGAQALAFYGGTRIYNYYLIFHRDSSSTPYNLIAQAELGIKRLVKNNGS